jgi:predicted TIM-barrel enzyme
VAAGVVHLEPDGRAERHPRVGAKSKVIAERHAADAERLLQAGVHAKVTSALYSSWFRSALNTARDASPRLIAFLLALKLGRARPDLGYGLLTC